MADFARVLAAADAAGITKDAFRRFLAQQGRIATEVVDADPFGAALVDFMGDRDAWTGTASELLSALLPESTTQPPHGWPKRNGVKGHLKRLTPALKSQGISVVVDERESSRERRRLIQLTKGKGSENIVQNVRTADTPMSLDPIADDSDDPDDRFPILSNCVEQIPQLDAADAALNNTDEWGVI
jgi:hypothetical protein